MSYPRISLIHPTGNPYSRNCAIALWEAGLLQEVITTIAYEPEGSLSSYLNLLPKKIRNRITQELGRRTWVPPTDVLMRTHPWREALRLALVKTGLSHRFSLNYQGLVDWVYASLDRHVASHHLQGLDAVYAYEDGAATTFRQLNSRASFAYMICLLSSIALVVRSKPKKLNDSLTLLRLYRRLRNRLGNLSVKSRRFNWPITSLSHLHLCRIHYLRRAQTWNISLSSLWGTY
jgi:hypothetical protein